MNFTDTYSVFTTIKRRFNQANVRTTKALRNIVLSFMYKGVNIIAGLLLVRYALEYLDPTRYGIWLTLSSIILWFNFFDVGLGHGLRNKLAQCIAQEKPDLGRRYVATAYGVLTIISLGFLFLFLAGNRFLNWNVLLNTNEIPGDELSILALLVFGSFSMRLVLRLINSVSFALQVPSVRDAVESASRVINLAMVIILYYSTESSLLYLGLVYSVVPIVVMAVFSVILFSGPYRDFVPRFKDFDGTLAGPIMGLGSRFFILQISAVVLFTTDNFIIAQLFSPADVTPYHIAHRYFGVAAMGFSIVVSPLWSATTEAYVKDELRWIRTTVRRLVFLWVLFVGLIVCMLLIAGKIYVLWIGEMVVIPFALSLAWAVYTAQQGIHGIFVRVINGVGKIRIQIIHAVASALVNIPLSIFFARSMGFGVTGVIVATTLTQIAGLFFMVVQYSKIINKRAYGVWNR